MPPLGDSTIQPTFSDGNLISKMLPRTNRPVGSQLHYNCQLPSERFLLITPNSIPKLKYRVSKVFEGAQIVQWDLNL